MGISPTHLCFLCSLLFKIRLSVLAALREGLPRFKSVFASVLHAFQEKLRLAAKLPFILAVLIASTLVAMRRKLSRLEPECFASSGRHVGGNAQKMSEWLSMGQQLSDPRV
jgi:hypothetical protein